MKGKMKTNPSLLESLELKTPLNTLPTLNQIPFPSIILQQLIDLFETLFWTVV
jgi:hypothetical protein